MTWRKWMYRAPLQMHLLLAYTAVLSLLLLQPVVAEVKGKTYSRLVAFADLHGDVYNCRLLLRAANITDAHDRWIAGNSTVVQLGDIADRGRHSHEIYDLFASLETQAAEAGGEFIFLVGNHELMNLLGDYAYVHEDMIKVFGGKTEYSVAFSPKGAYGSYIMQHQVVLVRGGVVFAHGGITPVYAAKGVDGINAEFHNGFNCQRQRESAAAGDGGSHACHPFSNAESPVWSRQLIYEGQQGNCGLLTESLRLLSAAERAAGRPPVHAMVVGHTIQAGGAIALLCGGRLVAADVGLSRYAWAGGGHAAFVEFPPPQRRPVPHYPYGVGVRPAAAVPLTQAIQPPRRTHTQQQALKEQHQDGEIPQPQPEPEQEKQEEEIEEPHEQKAPIVMGASSSSFVGRSVETPHIRLVDYVFLFVLLALVGSLFVLKKWRSLLRDFRVNLKET
ncbi:putative serine/threonine protein phosphatase [Trypanosoma theileri]|uniref:Putative serine/threonine protein phosphatase n=1 Tax=Trypanosoma theileri TaxID=67003 RepID=A0A1X0NZX7_9TRYP|nr:putative serine/threonine protein phosphatase [Trypanosoma theileri]ORC90098.1 putative serine/threonine protein phosphatase [Trypanosoma theileri]